MITPFIKGLISVQELSLCIKQLVKDAFPFVAVYGEVSNLRKVGKITYFTLKDDASRISVVVFDALEQPIKEGQSVIVEGRVDVYIVSGSYQIIARKIKQLGIGVLQQKFELLKEKLRAEGLFAPEKKLPIPTLPEHIGVITSPEAAALQDFLRVLERKGWRGKLTLSPSLVQGQLAPRSIERAFKKLSQDATIELIVLIRGGGSFEDLNCFNDEHLVRFLSQRKKPLITGIGHEINTTLCDFVADQRAETPTAVAEMIAHRFQQAQEALLQATDRLCHVSQNYLQNFRQTFALMQQKLQALHPALPCKLYQEKLLQTHQRMMANFQHQLQLKQSTFAVNIVAFEHFPFMAELEKRTMTLQQQTTRLKSGFDQHWEVVLGQYQNAYRQLSLSDPDRLLSCGLIFPIQEVTREIRDVHALHPGDTHCFLHKSGCYKVRVIEKLD